MEMVTIDRFMNPWDAHIVRGRLEAEGVVVWVIDEHHIGLYWLYSFALGQVKLQVAASAFDDAMTVMRRLEQSDYENALEKRFPHSERWNCPHCGGDRLYYRVGRSALLLAVMVYAIFGIPYPPHRNIAECANCQRRRLPSTT